MAASGFEPGPVSPLNEEGRSDRFIESDAGHILFYEIVDLMRILVGANVPPDPNSGAAGTVYHTNRALADLGHDVDEIWDKDIGRRIRHGNLHYLVELPRRYRDVVAQRCLQVNYDVIQLSQPHAFAAARDHCRRRRPGVFVNRSHGVEPMVHEINDQWQRKLKLPQGPKFRRILTQIMRRLLDRHFVIAAKYCDGFVVGAQDNGDYLSQHLRIPSKRIAVIPHSIPDRLSAVQCQPFSERRIKRILYVGQYTFIKGPDILAALFSAVLQSRNDLAVTWVCASEHHEQARSKLPNSIRERVNMIGWQTESKLLEIYDEHGIFVFPSFFEGFGKTPLEAMSRGLCVISSEVGGMRDYIRDGKNGFLVEPGDVELMASRIFELCDDLSLATKISTQAVADACVYTWRRGAEDLTRFYQNLLDFKYEHAKAVHAP